VIELLDTFHLFFISCSILHLTWITFDRYLAVGRPYKHRVYVTRKRTTLVLSITWVSTLLISISLYVIDEVLEEVNNEVESHITRDFVPLFVAGFILLADFIFVIVYTVIVLKYKAQTTSQLDYTNRKLAYICGFTVFTFVLLASPNAICSIVSPVTTKNWTDIMLLLNSGVNSFIYFFRTRIGEALTRNRTRVSSGNILPPLQKEAAVLDQYNAEEVMSSTKTYDTCL